jgi:hypothetical protein
MFNWLKRYATEPHTRYFLLNWILYGILTIGTFFYVYARLDYVRSGPKTKTIETTNQK